MQDAPLCSPGPGAPRSHSFHLLFDLRSLGMITIQGFQPLRRQAAAGRRNPRENAEPAKLGGSARRKGIMEASRTSEKSGDPENAACFNQRAALTCGAESPWKQGKNERGRNV